MNTLSQTSGLFGEHVKLAGVVDTNYMLLPVLERLGIGLGFGEESVGEACRRAGVRPSFFVLLCAIHTFDDYVPDAAQIENADPLELIAYLRNSHEYYSRRQVPRLREKLDRLVASCRSAHSELLSRFFDNYQRELDSHFLYEDEKVFPYVEDIAQGRPSDGEYSIERFEQNHENIDEKLDDLKNIILKYLPDVCDETLRTDALFDIYRLRDDLERHTMMENKILVPLVEKLEEAGR